MNVLAHGQGLATFFIVEAIIVAGFLISLVVLFFAMCDVRARRRCLLWSAGFLAAAFLWPKLFDDWMFDRLW